MSFGTNYAGVYDALYGDKNYASEALFALNQIRIVTPKAAFQILDLGCGTGLHALYLAQAGISVTGVDRSTDMVSLAEKRKKLLSDELRAHLKFNVGDIRTVDFHRRYDAVLSLFHVISYLIEDKDLDDAFLTARRHLDVGGAFIFDFWYGPAVLRDPPQPRMKTIQVGERQIQRRMVPEWDRQRSRVCVNYELEIKDIASGETTQEWEQHMVRYFFREDIESRLAASGFEVVHFAEWLTGNPPSDSTFGVFALAKAK